MKLCLFVVSLVFVSGVGLAAGPLKNLDQNPYETLKNFYENSTTSAKIGDFDELGKTVTIKCAGVSGATDKDVSEFGAPVTYTYVHIKGRPAEGPLFPGTSDQMRTVIMSSGYGESQYDPYRDKVAENIQIQTSGMDLTMSIDVGVSGLDFSSLLPYRAYFRKQNNLIVVKEVLMFGTTTESTHYMYCWKN